MNDGEDCKASVLYRVYLPDNLEKKKREKRKKTFDDATALQEVFFVY